MDPKSLAKSKRSFTQSHTKKSHHSNRKQAPSTGKDATGNSKKLPEKQTKEKIHLSSADLPSRDSNPDRSEDSFHIHPEGERSTTANVVVHKSNGADYRLLISEAEALPPINACLDPFAALDDFLPDFRQGLRSMLSVRGEGAFSLMKDDTFILDDEATMDPETPSLLSLDLSALAHHLRKVDLSKRLFADPDTPLPHADVPAEVHSEGSESGGLSLRKSGGGGHGEPGAPVADRATLSPASSGMSRKERMAGYEAEEAEAELDMLLNSTASLGSPRPSNHGSSRVTDAVRSKVEVADQVVQGDVISGFDAWLDTI